MVKTIVAPDTGPAGAEARVSVADRLTLPPTVASLGALAVMFVVANVAKTVDCALDGMGEPFWSTK